ncbi:MAG: hypothetical protein NT069_00780 [Planctomycetota bacterium]|nr:hypothetical protein [Planctomycetota bacterium]
MTPRHNLPLLPLLLMMLMVFVSVLATAAESAPQSIGDQPLLFVDLAIVAKSTGVSLKLHPPRKTGERLLTAEHPWESATLNWFTVLRDGERFRMWYECYDVDGWPTTDDTSFCYAESQDGIHWTKPELGLHNYKGSSANNILFRQVGEGKHRSRVHGHGLFIDPTAPPDSRYKCVSQGMFQGIGDRPYYIAGMTSPDGLRWTRQATPICPVFADSQYSAFWDESLKQYVLYGRVGGRGRAIGRSTSARFDTFPPLKLVFENSDDNPPRSDWYNPACSQYPGQKSLYVMLPSQFRHQPDTLDIHLAVSRDGVKWTSPDRSTPFIPLGRPEDFDGGSLYAANGIVEVGDELWFYFSGAKLKHEETTIEKLAKPENRRVFSRAVAKKDRLVSLHTDESSGEKPGTVETIPILFEGNQLHINAATRAGGVVRVALLDEQGKVIPGRGLDDCIPFEGDQVSHRVAWKTGFDVADWASKPVSLRLELVNADVYSVRFQKP